MYVRDNVKVLLAAFHKGWKRNSISWNVMKYVKSNLFSSLEEK